MKKSFILITMAALLTTACGHRASAGGTESDSDSVATDSAVALATDSIGQMKADTAVSVRISADWPSGSNEALVNSIRQYICEQLAIGLTLEGEPDVKLYNDGQTAMDSTTQQQYKRLKASYKESQDYGVPMEGMQYSYNLHVGVLEESDTYVTYISNQESFLGGAHGSATSTGQTFRKSDGRRIGYHTCFNHKTEQFEVRNQTLFSKPDDATLSALIREGVRSYFQVFDDNDISDEDLKELLIGVNSVDSIPLPSSPPYFTGKGLSFIYQQYEIAPYAAGMINFDVSYDKVLPLLTKDAAALVK